MQIELLLVSVFILGYSFGRLPSQNSVIRSALLERKMDAIIKALNISFDPYADVPEDILELVRKGERVKAIKRYRKFAKVGLKEACSAIDDIEERV